MPLSRGQRSADVAGRGDRGQTRREPVSEGDDPAQAELRLAPLPGGDVTVDEMSEASFPASDPPATWTWEVAANASDADEAD